jgi:hypothetical protein
VFINTVDANTGYTADVAMDSFICQGANAGYTADAAMYSYICQTQDCSYSSTHFYQRISSDLDDEDEDWRATFGGSDDGGESSKEHIMQ